MNRARKAHIQAFADPPAIGGQAAMNEQENPGLKRSEAKPLRCEAERRMHDTSETPVEGMAEGDVRAMLHELQVHQIELEMQNEELLRAQAALQAVSDSYRDLFDFAPVGYFSLDEQGLILEVNLTGAALLRVERSSLTNLRFQLFVRPPGRRVFQTFLETIFAGQEQQACETPLLNSEHAFWASLQGSCAMTRGGTRRCARVAVIDITARKQAEAAQHRIDILAATNRRLEAEIIRRQAVETALTNSEQRAQHLLEESRQLQENLRNVSHQILMAQENLRKEISHELHDKITQLLVGINVHLGIFTESALANPESIRRAIAPLRRQVEQSVQTVHQFASKLRPSMLDHLGLTPALRTYINEFPKRKGRTIHFTAQAGVEVLDNDKRTILYRVAQEALTNVAKHARAKVVTVALAKSRGSVSLEVADDGKGFDMGVIASVRRTHRLGITGMRERVEMVGGRFTIESAPGTGTTIHVVVPVGKSKRSQEHCGS